VSAAPPAVKQASVNGVDLVYLEQGQGAPVVFVHGAFSDHRAWEGQREVVAQRHRYIALTQRYFGTSLWPDSGEKYSLATHADDLAVFIRELKAGPVHVVGWSYGGAIALVLAVQHPELLKSLFLHEPARIGSFVTDPADAKAGGEDRREMVGPAAGASKAGDTAGVVRLFFDGVNGQPGTFEALPPAARSMFLDNAHDSTPLRRAAAPRAQLRPAGSDQGARDRGEGGADAGLPPDPSGHGQPLHAGVASCGRVPGTALRPGAHPRGVQRRHGRLPERQLTRMA
jgi:pimeloyl-ACP methyl ester carboxylesterase